MKYQLRSVSVLFVLMFWFAAGELARANECSEIARARLIPSPNGKSAALLAHDTVAGPRDAIPHTLVSQYGSSIDLLSLERPRTDWADEICVVGLGEQSVFRLRVREAGAKYSFPAWSPDSTWLAYIEKSKGEYNLWVLSADGAKKRKVSNGSVNVLIEGSHSTAHRRAPFAWKPDSEFLLYLSTDRFEIPAAERLERFSKPRVIDTRPRAASRDSLDYATSISMLALNGRVREFNVISGENSDLFSHPLVLFHLEYAGPTSLLLGIVEKIDSQETRRFYLVPHDGVFSTDWREKSDIVPATNRSHIISASSDQSRIRAIQSADALHCRGGLEEKRDDLLCLTVDDLPYRVNQSEDFLLIADYTGHVATFDKASGRRLSSRQALYDRKDNYIPGVTPLLRASDGSLYIDENGKMLLVQWRAENSEYRAFRIANYDPVSGDQTVLFEDSTNDVGVVRFHSMTDTGDIYIERAIEAGRIEHAVLNGPSWTPRPLATAFRTDLTFSDFEHSDLRYAREDGIDLMGRVFWPSKSDLSDQGMLPMVVWQYPVHFDSQFEVLTRYQQQQRRDSKYSVTNELDYVGDWLPLRLLEAGFAVFHYPAAPLIGSDDETEFGTFEHQMVLNAMAAVQAAVETGRVDVDRVAVGGHSRGGGDAALLLAHTDLFRAGISVAGQMNAMLMTSEKQYDERPFWEAPTVYVRASASAQANKIDEPILLIHGVVDGSNARSATSESMFKGIHKSGGTARLVLLPFMGHQVKSDSEWEIVETESIDWLTTYLAPSTASGDNGSEEAE